MDQTSGQTIAKKRGKAVERNLPVGTALVAHADASSDPVERQVQDREATQPCLGPLPEIVLKLLERPTASVNVWHGSTAPLGQQFQYRLDGRRMSKVVGPITFEAEDAAS